MTDFKRRAQWKKRHATLLLCFLLLWPSLSWAKLDLEKESTIPGGNLVIVAYLILWVLTLGYVALIGRRQTHIDRELETLGRRLDDVGWEGEHPDDEKPD
jgi:CcmD family protein